MLRVALFMLLGTLIFASNAAAGPWGPVTTVAPVGGPGSSIENIVQLDGDHITTRADARGDVVVAWTRDDRALAGGTRHVELAFKPAGQAWLSPEEVGPPSSVLQALAMDGHGNVTVAYGSLDDSFASQASVVTRSADGSYSPVHLLGVPYPAPNAPLVERMTVDPAGDLLILYIDQASSGGIASTVFRPAGGAWQQPVVLEPHAIVNGLAVLGMEIARDGEATVLELTTSLSHVQSVQARRFSLVSGWGPPVPVFAPPPDMQQGVLAVDAGGNATYAVIFPDGRLETTSRAEDASGWTPLSTLGTLEARIGCRPLRLVVAASGDAVVACPEVVGVQGRATAETYAAVRGADGVWGPLQQVASDWTGNASNDQLAMTDDGRAFLLTATDASDGRSADPQLLEHAPGQQWAVLALPSAPSPSQTWCTIGGGTGSIVAVAVIGQSKGPEWGYGLAAAVLDPPALPTAPTTPTSSEPVAPAATPAPTEPSTLPVGTGEAPLAPAIEVPADAAVPAGVTVPSDAAAPAAASLGLISSRTCTAARPCPTGRDARLAVTALPGQRVVRLTVQRMVRGRWRALRTVRVRPSHGRVSLHLPAGHVRVTARTPNALATHSSVTYLVVR